MARESVYATGPLFVDPVDHLTKAANRALLDIAVEGSVRVKNQLYKGHGRISANLRNHVGGTLVKAFHAQIDAGEAKLGHNIVYATWVEGVSSLNKKRNFAGYGMFKNVKEWLMRGSPEIDKFFQDALLEEFD